MTTHGENIGSRKVEPETRNLPRWRLKANYLMRQLARIWYGKLPAQDYLNTAEIERLFLEIVSQFVEDHGGNRNEVFVLIVRGKSEFEVFHGKEIRFKDRISELWWITKNGVPKELSEQFANDETILGILWTFEYLLNYIKEEKAPPYEPEFWLKPLDYYEQLPVLEPEPIWRLMANKLLGELARMWYGKAKGLSVDFQERLWQLLLAFAIDKGNTKKEFLGRVWEAEADFESMHGCELTFTTPVQAIIWKAKAGLHEMQATEFLNDPQVRFVLTAAELIYALSKAGIRPPYEKYSVVFGPLAEYESLPILPKDWSF